MPRRDIFFTNEYIVEAALEAQSIGNHMKTMSLIYAFVEYCKPEISKMAPLLLYAAVKSLVKMDEKLVAFQFVQQFSTAEYFAAHKESEEAIVLIYLDLFLDLSGYYVSVDMKDPKTLAKIRDCFQRFMVLECQPENPLYQKVDGRIRQLHQLMKVIIQADTLRYQRTRLASFFQDIKDTSSLALSTEYLTNLDVSEGGVSDFKRQLKILTNPKAREKCRPVYMQSSALRELPYFFKLATLEFNETPDIVQLFEQHLRLTLQQTSFDQFHLALMYCVKGLLQCFVHTVTRLKRQFSGVILLAAAWKQCEVLLDIRNKQAQNYYLEGHLEALQEIVQYNMELFQELLTDKADDIAGKETLGNIYNAEFFLYESIKPEFAVYQNDERLCREMLQTTHFSFDVQSIVNLTRRRFAEIYLQIAMELVKKQATMAAVQYLSESVKAFPLEQAYTLLARVFARSGREKEAREIQEEWEAVAACASLSE